VLVEGYGGTIPWVPISALNGTGVSDLLETILLVADLESLTYDNTKNAEGIVIESHLDAKRGITGTLIVKNGVLTKGDTVVAGDAITSTRIMENFLGNPISEAVAGTPVVLVGFDKQPTAGALVASFTKKRDAEEYLEEQATHKQAPASQTIPDGARIVPIIVKADVLGSVEAVEKEINKISVENIYIKIIRAAIGPISEADIKLAQSDKDTIIIGFHVGVEGKVRDLNEGVGVAINTFDIIYKLTEWLEIELEVRRPRSMERVASGSAKVLKCFSKTKERQVLGVRIESGTLHVGNQVSLVRRDFPLANGTIIELQQAKQKTKEITEGECGLMIECKTDAVPGDIIEAFSMIEK